ncbi:MAG: hypothetical protein ACKOX6_01865 [Bdellovibrio sp.]
MRVLVMGSSCSGKSFYSRKISSKYDIEMYDLDFVHFDKDFQVLAREERQQRLINICTEDSWIACGILDYQLKVCADRATHLLWVQEPNRVLLCIRFFKRIFTGERKLREVFKLSMIKWLLSYNLRPANGFKTHQMIFESFCGRKIRLTSHDDVEF